MTASWSVALIGVGFAALAWFLYRASLQQTARARLAQGVTSLEARAVRAAPSRLTPAPRWAAPAVAVIGGGTALIAGVHPLPASGLAAIPAVLVHVVLARRVEQRALRLEEQLAEAIRLAAAALRAGVSPTEALERATRESRAPLRPHLDGLIGRLRLGDDPQRSLAELAERVPLHPFRLFATALGVQWSAGGSLQGSLQTVGRTISERSELARRIDTQQAPTRSSVIAIAGANVAIAALAWVANPLNLERFLASETGSAMLAATLWLQALALWWMWRLGRRRA